MSHWARCGSTTSRILALPKTRGVFELPRATEKHFCYGHESNVVPMSGPRDIVVNGWFGGGVNLVDFTDPGRPREIAYWVSAAPDGEHSFAYAGYWYNGHVYAGNTALEGMDEPPVTLRGFDVFAVEHPVLRDDDHAVAHERADAGGPPG